MEPVPLTRIVSRTCADANGMEMLDDAVLLGYTDLHAQNKLQGNSTPQQRFVGELRIPKKEPPDAFEQTLPMDEEALTDLNLRRTLIPFATPYKLKDPVIVLERCDKIWETLTLIKNAQNEDYSGDSDTEDSRHEEEVATEDKNPCPRLTYVQYKPVLENNNANFKLSVKTTQKLYNCVSCGSFYPNKRYLQAHVFKVHGMPMPVNDFEPNGIEDSEVKLAKVHPTERSKNIKVLERVQEPISQAECEPSKEKDLDAEYVTCMKCNLPIKDIIRHLDTYHKIPYSDIMENQYWKPLTPEGQRRIIQKNQHRKKDKTSASLEKPDIPVNPNADQQDSFTSRKRRSSATSQREPKRRCTGENTNILESHNLSDPEPSNAYPSLQAKDQSKSVNPVVNGARLRRESKSKTNSTIKDTNGELDSDLTNGRSVDRLNGIEEVPETTCVCGRSFRTLYAFSTHKTRCHIQDYINGIEGPTNSDKDSSVGLNFTIKKHNNSYEIVGRGADDNDRPQSADVTKGLNGISRTAVMQADAIVTHLAEYSKDHTFVKLEIADEDITVDIEDDPKPNVVTTGASPESDITGEENVQDENIDTENSKNKAIKPRRKRSYKIIVDDSKLKPPTNGIKYICLCGSGYQTEESLKDHIVKDHALCFKKCGYCKMIFKNINELNDHSCLVIKGEPFQNLMKLPCTYCNIILDIDTFDEHISSKHLVTSKNLFKCYECDSYFGNPSYRQRHMTRTHDLRHCNFCSKTVSLRARPKHDAYHFGLGFPCHDCKLAYVSIHTLRDHRDNVHSRRRKALS